MFQTLLTNSKHETVAQFLKELINSNHHFWQGDKYEEGMTWTFTDDNGKDAEYKNVKTFGLVDNNDIKPSDYKIIDFDILESRLTSFILKETADNDYATKIKTLLKPYKNQRLTAYQFIPDNLERSKFSVYSYFIAFILLDKELKKVIRIEFGQD